MGHVGRAIPQQDRSREKYERILDAADEMFATSGVRETQMTMLARAAGVSVGSLYRLFVDRDEIALALGARYLTLLMAELEDVRLENLAVLESVTNDLVDRWLDFQDRHPGYRALLLEYAGRGRGLSLSRALFETLFPALVADLAAMVPAMDRRRLEMVVANAFDLIRHFLLRLPDENRTETVDEVKQMVAFYVCGRLRPDLPVRWPPPDSAS